MAGNILTKQWYNYNSKTFVVSIELMKFLQNIIKKEEKMYKYDVDRSLFDKSNFIFKKVNQ